MKRAATVAVVATALFTVHGCSLLQMKDKKAELAWEARRERLARVDRFTVQARVASGGLFGVKGNLHWRQDGGDFEMRVAGPFGIGAAHITGHGRQVEIRSSKGTFTTTDPERDIRERLGWAFPVSHLRYWVLGLPAPGSRAVTEIDRLGRIVALEQDDWNLEFTEYQTAGHDDLPRKFAIANDEVRIKVVVDEWNVD